MNVDIVSVGPIEANCYILSNPDRQALVIDPGADAPAIEAILRRRQLTVAVYLVTHGHMDHISALADLAAQCPAPIGMATEDIPWAFGPLNEMPPHYPRPRRPQTIDRLLTDNQTWTDAGMTYGVVATPGHSPGSVCFYFKEATALFTGDTLFQGSVGRTDLPGGDNRRLAQSLKILARLPPATRIYPGHGPATTLAAELKTNLFLKSPGGGRENLDIR